MNTRVYNAVETVLLQNISKPRSCFVFPTDIATSRWADHLLRIKGGSVAMNKFIAWDVFKQNSIRSKIQNEKCIPSALRKIFVSRLIKENSLFAENEFSVESTETSARSGKTRVFNSLIQVRWAGGASQFTSWITDIIPQLGTWYKKTTGLSIDSILDSTEKTVFSFEGEYRDLFILAKYYAQFLKKHALFEPAWETPPFNEDGKEYFIFFPSSLSDYSEYKQLLEGSGHVKIINADNAGNALCDSFFYTNSRREITEAALYIRALAERSNIDWDSIAVCIPDSQDYEPYIMREFKNRNIPFVKRISKPLSDYPAGRFFRSALDCISQNFSFSSVVSLLINRNLPWKDRQQIDKLVNFGIENNCLCSWTEEIDGKEQHINIWEDSFSKPINEPDSETRNFFEHLKQKLQSMRYVGSFSELRKQYFSFRSQFFDMEKCSEETDLILSRCISELINLAEIERNFLNDCTEGSIDYFSFFTDYLEEIFYLARQKTTGVTILSYKAAAAAPFDCHIILGAGQENLSVVHSRLGFLSKQKRKKLDILEKDASEDFITLHKFNSIKVSAFFCSEQTFSGFTIPHSKIGFSSEPLNSYAVIPKFKEKFSADYYNVDFFINSVSNSPAFVKIHENQVNSFFEWKNRRFSDEHPGKKWNTVKKTQELISSYFEKDGKYSVSATSLQIFFQCSLKWLFESVLELENIQLETNLMQESISGIIYHAILDNFFRELKNKKENLLFPVYTNSGISLPSDYMKLLERSINRIFDAFHLIRSKSSDRDLKISVLTSRLMNAGKKDFQFHLVNCLAHFLSFFSGCRVTDSEISYRSERDSYFLKGTVDCILEDFSDPSERKYIIVDFKLKNIPLRSDCTGEEETALSNFQLPMYITLTEENKKIKVYTALFYSILDSQPEVIFGSIHEKETGKTIPKKEEQRIIHGDERYDKIFNEFNKRTELFSKEIATGNFTVFESRNSNCFECACCRICRTTYVIDRENLKTLGSINGIK